MTSTAIADRDAAGRDFGGAIQRRPAAVVHARTAGDVIAAIAWAAERGLPVAARGQGHSLRGQSLVDGGLVIELRGLDRIEVANGRAVAGAGARWDAVVEATLAHGLVPPTLTDYLGLSVGGTLSVGGFGGHSFRHGAQVDNVVALRVVTGRGELVECSRESNRDLFEACRAGLGQCAIIVDATLSLVAALPLAQTYRLPFAELATFLAAQRRLVHDQRFDYLLGTMVPAPAGWTFSIEATRYVTTDDDRAVRLDDLGCDGAILGPEHATHAAYANRLAGLALQTPADARHPWVDLLVPAHAATSIIGGALDRLDPALLAAGHLMTYPLCRAASSTPCLPLPDGEHAFLFDILPCLRDDTLVRRHHAICDAIVDDALAAGARIYPIGYPIATARMTAEVWRRQLGSAWDAFAAAKHRYDPELRLTPGFGIFSAVFG